MIFGLWGEDKTCKTTLALTFPKPLVFMEFDIGGFDRAIYRFQEELDKELTCYEPYPMPMTFGTLDPAHLAIKPTKIIIGMKELFYKWAASYLKHLNDPKIKTIVIDTATLMYSINCDCYLQELQEKQLPLRTDGKGSDGKTLRSQLLQIEYREPNNRMRGILYNAKSHGKNLVMVHHARDEYKPMPQKDGSLASAATGKRVRSGFTTLGDSADVIVHTFIKEEPVMDKGKQIGVKATPFCSVDLSEVLELAGMEFKQPNYDDIYRAISFIKGGRGK